MTNKRPLEEGKKEVGDPLEPPAKKAKLNSVIRHPALSFYQQFQNEWKNQQRQNQRSPKFSQPLPNPQDGGAAGQQIDMLPLVKPILLAIQAKKEKQEAWAIQELAKQTSLKKQQEEKEKKQIPVASVSSSNNKDLLPKSKVQAINGSDAKTAVAMNPSADLNVSPTLKNSTSSSSSLSSVSSMASSVSGSGSSVSSSSSNSILIPKGESSSVKLIPRGEIISVVNK